jgi:hypothetical protein
VRRYLPGNANFPNAQRTLLIEILQETIQAVDEKVAAAEVYILFFPRFFLRRRHNVVESA